ncbi:caspase-like isoform X3 [Schistocerca cancellata]|uniref:caspase-like isoform X2 n=1 Tax=Schistocerca cancellata TaxID=274614 RepID=UPI0021191E0C|nr:caspase-like isoform X2 [Schistocerca cancellata]XP_049764049.1 caspase-like isoform X3 [Schistocerca cancellata]
MEQGYESSDSGVYDIVDIAFPFEYPRQPGKDYSGGAPHQEAGAGRSGFLPPGIQIPAHPLSTQPEDVVPIHGVSGEDEEYPMGNQEHGIALILNHEFFEEDVLRNREGTEIDRNALIRAFTTLGFEVRCFDNLTYREIRQQLRRVAEEDHVNCVAVAVLSHGGANNVLFAKDQEYHVSDLLEPFRPAQCPRLVGKPKLFFIQASRGWMAVTSSAPLRHKEKTSYHTPPVQASESSPMMKHIRFAPNPQASRRWMTVTPLALLPYTPPVQTSMERETSESGIFRGPVNTYGDVLISYSTSEGSHSFRNLRNGAWYVQTLCAQLEAHGRTKDLVSLLTDVNRIVSEQFRSYNPQNPELHNKIQEPCFTSALKRRLYFR